MKRPDELPIILEHCTLRQWRADDAPGVPKYANNRKVSLCLRDRFPFPYREEDAREFLKRLPAEEDGIALCIDVNGEVAGGIGLQRKEDVHRFVAEFGYWLGEPFWGRGIVTEAIGAFVDFAFAKYPLHRLYAEVFSNNPASARVLEKNGFILEGRLKKHVFKNGELLDALVYAKTRESFATPTR